MIGSVLVVLLDKKLKELKFEIGQLLADDQFEEAVRCVAEYIDQDVAENDALLLIRSDLLSLRGDVIAGTITNATYRARLNQIKLRLFLLLEFGRSESVDSNDDLSPNSPPYASLDFRRVGSEVHEMVVQALRSGRRQSRRDGGLPWPARIRATRLDGASVCWGKLRTRPGTSVHVVIGDRKETIYLSSAKESGVESGIRDLLASACGVSVVESASIETRVHECCPRRETITLHVFSFDISTQGRAHWKSPLKDVEVIQGIFENVGGLDEDVRLLACVFLAIDGEEDVEGQSFFQRLNPARWFSKHVSVNQALHELQESSRQSRIPVEFFEVGQVEDADVKQWLSRSETRRYCRIKKVDVGPTERFLKKLFTIRGKRLDTIDRDHFACHFESLESPP